MRGIFILIICSFVSSYAQNSCIEDLFNITESRYAGAYLIKIDSSIKDRRITIDSLNYRIIRTYKKGSVFCSTEKTTNLITHVIYNRIFDDHGFLESCGYSTSTNIGLWTFYGDSSVVERKIDYEKDRKLSFCDFYAIAKGKNCVGPEWYFCFDQSALHWRAEKWVWFNGAQYSEGIYVDMSTKDVTRFSFPVEKKYSCHY